MSYKYLVYNPLFGNSHSTFLGKIADTLQEAGHEVTVLMPLQDHLLKGKTGVKSSAKQIHVPQEKRTHEIMEHGHKTFFVDFWTMEHSALSFIGGGMDNFTLAFMYTCENMLRDEELLNSLRAEKFDVAIAEPLFLCGFGLFKHLGIKSVIGALSNVHYESISWTSGEPFPASYVPSLFSTTGEDMNILERFYNLFGVGALNYMGYTAHSMEIEIMNKVFGTDFKSADLIGDMSLLFTNSNPYLDFPRPLLAKTVQIGGISIDVNNAGTVDEVKHAFNERSKTVYVSFGSVAKSKDMPLAWKKAILEVFASLPEVTFIWKYEEDTDMASHLPNVHLLPWLPQNALLADPRVSLFITHGGLGSTNEVAHFGKPAILVPLFADQPRNANMLARHNGSIVFKKFDLGDSEAFRQTILSVLNDERFNIFNAVEHRFQFRNKCPTSLKNVARTTFLAKGFGGPACGICGKFMADISFDVIPNGSEGPFPLRRQSKGESRPLKVHFANRARVSSLSEPTKSPPPTARRYSHGNLTPPPQIGPIRFCLICPNAHDTRVCPAPYNFQQRIRILVVEQNRCPVCLRADEHTICRTEPCIYCLSENHHSSLCQQKY